MTTTYSAELFDAEGINPRIRWLRNGSPVADRRLDRTEVDQLLGFAAAYQAHPPLERDVLGVGDGLYRWLDGPAERWLSAARDEQEPIVLYLSGQERLRALPWEVMFSDGFVCVDPYRPVMPVRSGSTRGSNTTPPEVMNRPLRVLFMASSPSDVSPVLDFEAEEAQILKASPNLVEVVVEESGSLAGLSKVLVRAAERFDVIHLSGHGTVTAQGPRFIVETEAGFHGLASADDIASALNRRWPRLLFVSGCWTGDAAAGLESLAESLVQAGAPAVLGWGLPVGDRAATRLAAALYRELGNGESLVDAVTIARQALFSQGANTDWHLLRLYADRSPLTPVVTAPGHRGRALLQTLRPQALFLDPEGRVRVATRESFVGRRRDLQVLLRQLLPADHTTGPQGVVIHGMGGLGKSSLTARLLERLQPTHPLRAVWTGRIDALEITTKLTRQLNLDADTDTAVKRLLNRDNASLEDRLRYILQGPLADVSHQVMFVFDDFENGNLELDGRGGHQLVPEAAEVLRALTGAITSSGTTSRIVITSRHNFHRPHEVRLAEWSIAELQGTELEKLLRTTKHLGPLSNLDPDRKDAALSAASGIPRLINILDELIDSDAASDDLVARVRQAKEDYREHLMLQALLDAQPTGVRRLLALATVYQIAVPKAAALALHPEADAYADFTAAVNSGLLQAGIHPATNETRYMVSSLLRPLLATMPERLEAEQQQATQARAAKALYGLWVSRGE